MEYTRERTKREERDIFGYGLSYIYDLCYIYGLVCTVYGVGFNDLNNLYNKVRMDIWNI